MTTGLWSLQVQPVCIALQERVAFGGVGRDPVVLVHERSSNSSSHSLPCYPLRPSSDASLERAYIHHICELAGPQWSSGFLLPAGTYHVSGDEAGSVVQSALLLSHPVATEMADQGRYVGVYRLLPWEDLRSEKGREERARTIRRLRNWASGHPDLLHRIRVLFGEAYGWSEERCYERLRLVQEAQILSESELPPRQLLAVAEGLGRLRQLIKASPAAIRALTGDGPTVVELFWTISAVAGRPLDKPNFWRLVTRSGHFSFLAPTDKKQAWEGQGPAPRIFNYAADVDLQYLDPPISYPWST